MVSGKPLFDEEKLKNLLIYPPMALRSGIEGRVILDLFIDRTGLVKNVAVMLEDPPGRGFGEAAVRAFAGFRCAPAMADGAPVAVRYRYPVIFRTAR
jgi:protein TonB